MILIQQISVEQVPYYQPRDITTAERGILVQDEGFDFENLKM
jgi:hypothetical protein